MQASYVISITITVIQDFGHIVIKIRFTINCPCMKNTPKTDIAGLEFNVQLH